MIAKKPGAGSILDTEPPLNLRTAGGTRYEVILKPLRELLEEQRAMLADFERNPNPYAEHTYIISRGNVSGFRNSKFGINHPWLNSVHSNLITDPNYDYMSDLKAEIKKEIETVLRRMIEVCPLEVDITSLEARAKNLIDSVHSAELCDEIIENVFAARVEASQMMAVT
ncbi:MAG: hypothetical protein QF755_04405 [Candidatus Peribacteraceae bacterium]|jgi:hypothetical protein|nr:hypothetical protein [Candidatus Peribacteraceae bacterium]|tara:strand:+ start:231 stop:737 length:507 start_codon:yes stop_codon:yes gene_type:complete